MATGCVIAVIITQPSLPFPRRPYIFPLNSLFRRSLSAKYTRWDSNAETVRSRGLGFDFKRRGQNDEEDDRSDDEDEEEEEDGFFRSKRKKRRWWSDDFDDGGIIEDAIGSNWVFKVFKAYGWFFPLILASWLLSSGPKAFLMALALPLGQSVLSYVFDKLWGGTKSRPKRRRRMTRKESASASASSEIEEEEEELRAPGKGKTGYQSWVVGNDGSVDKGGQRETSFGGWDDLERAKSAQRTSRMRDTGSEKTVKEKKGKLSRRPRKSDTPLLLRLLVAVFPFLGSWTKMLW